MLYYGESGLYRMTVDGSITEQVIDGRLPSLSMPNISVYELFGLESGDLLFLAFQKDIGYRLLNYAFDSSVPTVPSHQVTICSLHENRDIRAAMSIFMQENPDVLVELQAGIAEESVMQPAGESPGAATQRGPI